MGETEEGIIGPLLGEITQESMEEANRYAEELLARGKRVDRAVFESPDGRKIEGVVFEDSERGRIVVADDFLGNVEKGTDRIDWFWPRK